MTNYDSSQFVGAVSSLFLKGLSAVAGLLGEGIGEAKAASHEIFGIVDAEILEMGLVVGIDQDVDIADVVLAIAVLHFSIERKLIDKIKTSALGEL